MYNNNNKRNRQRQNRRRTSQAPIVATYPIQNNKIMNNYQYTPMASIVNDGSAYAIQNNITNAMPSVFNNMLSPDDLMNKVNNSIHNERQSYYEDVFSSDNLDNYQKEYNYKYNSTDEDFLKEYDDVIKGKIQQNNDNIIHNKNVNEELKKSSKKYKAKDKQGQVIGDKVNYHQNISSNIIKQEAADKNNQNVENFTKNYERQQRRQQRSEAITRKEEYANLFKEADHAEALEINNKFDHYNNLFNEADHLEALKMNNNYDEHAQALSDNKIFDQMQKQKVDYDVDSKIREAIKKSKGNDKDSVYSALNKMAREGELDDNLLSIAKKQLNNKYDDVYKDIIDSHTTLKKIANKKIVSGKDSYNIRTNNEKTIGLSQKIPQNEAAEKALKKEMEEQASKNLQKSTMKHFGHVMNLGVGIMDYKDSREAGNSVSKSVAKAGMEFVKGEVFGGWYMAAMVAKGAPKAIMSTIEGVNTMSRSMNSLQRRQVFGDSQFQDTQQLATMRQSGMELAKMSQYNLQQSLMGNEAEYMHRL